MVSDIIVMTVETNFYIVFFIFFSNYEAFSNNLTCTYLEKYYMILSASSV